MRHPGSGSRQAPGSGAPPGREPCEPFDEGIIRMKGEPEAYASGAAAGGRGEATA